MNKELGKEVEGGPDGVNGVQGGLFRHQCDPLARMKFVHNGLIVIIRSKVACFWLNNGAHCNQNSVINGLLSNHCC